MSGTAQLLQSRRVEAVDRQDHTPHVSTRGPGVPIREDGAVTASDRSQAVKRTGVLGLTGSYSTIERADLISTRARSSAPDAMASDSRSAIDWSSAHRSGAPRRPGSVSRRARARCTNEHCIGGCAKSMAVLRNSAHVCNTLHRYKTLAYVAVKSAVDNLAVCQLSAALTAASAVGYSRISGASEAHGVGNPDRGVSSLGLGRGLCAPASFSSFDRLSFPAVDRALVLRSPSILLHPVVPVASILLKHEGLTRCGQRQRAAVR